MRSLQKSNRSANVIAALVGPYSGKQTGENGLLRTLHVTLNEGDVLVLDRYFSGWFDIALLQQRGVDVVVRKHQLSMREPPQTVTDDWTVLLAFADSEHQWVIHENDRSTPFS